MKRFVIGAVVGLALAGSAAYATIPDAGGVIHACMLNRVGTIRIIDPSQGQKCSTSLETPIDWNQKGTAGGRGPTGVAGVNGTRGPTGPKGDVGQNGSAGTNGTRGPTGSQGPIGPSGPKGDPGQNGSRGASGPAGPTGTQGVAGPTGPKGATGASGAPGSGGETFQSFAIAINGTPVTVVNDPAIGQVDAKCSLGLNAPSAGLIYTNTSSTTHSVGLVGGGGTILQSSVPPGGTRSVPSGRTPIGWDVTTTPGASEPVMVIESFDRVLPSNTCVFIVGVELGD